MQLDKNFTQQLQQFLAAPEDERDYAIGNRLLLQLSNNRIRYANFARDPERKAEFINYQLQKYLKFRLADVTHAEVIDMEQQVAKIDEQVGLDKENSSYAKANEEFRAGKCADHDSLPEDIQALYTENLSILQRMREVHLMLRSQSVAESPCPDSERYPFLKELIEMDKKLHANWDAYDHYKIE